MTDLPNASPLKSILIGAELAARRLAPHCWTMPGEGTLQEITDAVILNRLAAFGGNRTHAARSLGLNVKTVYNHLKRLGISS